MAIVQFTGFETGQFLTSSTGSGEVVNGFSGTQDTNISVQSSVKRTGGWALRVFPTTTNWENAAIGAIATDGRIDTTTGFDIATSYTQFYFYVATAPASDSEEFFRAVTAASALKFSVRLTSARTLEIYDATGTIIGSAGSTVLSLTTWYQIRVKVGTSLTVGAYEVQINGATEFSGTGNLGATNNVWIGLGKGANANGQSVDFYYDDTVIDDAAFPTGAASCLAIIPNANGSTMNWGTGTNTSDYTQVDLVPEDGVEYVRTTTGAGTPIVGLFDLQSCADVGVSGTIQAFKGVITTRENASNTSAHICRIFSNATALDNSVAFNGSTLYVTQSIIALVDPDTSAAWTTGGIDAVEVGAVENNNVSVRCDAVLGMVLFTAATTAIKTVDGLAVASVKTVDGLAIASVKTINGLQ